MRCFQNFAICGSPG